MHRGIVGLHREFAALQRGIVSLRCGIAGLQHGIVSLHLGNVSLHRDNVNGKNPPSRQQVTCKSFVLMELNGKDAMELWTVHDTDDFKLSEGHVDHSKSDYYNNTPGVKEAYHQLWPLIRMPDGQIIWCYTRKEDFRKTGIPKIMYTLEVPEDSVITYIDDIMWNCILEIRVNLTPSYKHDIKAEAENKFPNDPYKRHRFEKQLEKKFWENKPPVEELWEKLRLDKAVDGSPALIKHPIPGDWITKRETIHCRGN